MQNIEVGQFLMPVDKQNILLRIFEKDFYIVNSLSPYKKLERVQNMSVLLL